MDLESHSISITRNVLFHEDTFPFKTSELLSQAVDMFQNTMIPLLVPLHYVEAMHLPDNVHDSFSHNSNEHNTALNQHVPSPASHQHSETLSNETGAGSVHVARSKRVSKAPSYFSEYHCSLLPSTSHSLPIPSNPICSIFEYVPSSSLPLPSKTP